jgi:hypothetical protein
LLVPMRNARILAASNYLVVMLKNLLKPYVLLGTKFLDGPAWSHEIAAAGSISGSRTRTGSMRRSR